MSSVIGELGPTRTGASAPVARIGEREYRAFVFDLDGVVTDTAAVHAFAWRQLFDDHLRGTGERAFSDEDYQRFVDGRARIDGVEAFLASRGIEVPRGFPSDPPSAGTQWGLANRKNHMFLDALDSGGIAAFPETLDLLRRLRAAGVQTALVTASHNAEPSRTRSLACERVGAAGSGSWSVSTARDTRPRSPRMALMWWWPTWRTCWWRHHIQTAACAVTQGALGCWTTSASTQHRRARVRRCWPWVTATSRRAVRGRRRERTTCITRGYMSRASITALCPKWMDTRARMRAW